MKDFNPKEYKVIALRDCPVPEEMQICEQPQQVADYWRLHIVNHPYFNPDCECFVVLLLNTRKRVKGHHLVSIGTMDTVLIHGREVFSVAITMKAAAIILIHNHPSGVIPYTVLCRMAQDLPDFGLGQQPSHAA
jgi:DNA repair protein RadC